MDDPDRKSRSDFIRIISALLYPGLSMDKRMEVLKEMDVEVDSIMADNLKRLTADEYYGMIHTRKLVDEARAEGLAEGRAEKAASIVLAYSKKFGVTIEEAISLLDLDARAASDLRQAL
jgi:hypothetical protein